MPNYGATDKVRKTAVERYIEPARQKNEATVVIHSGDFNRYLVQKNVLPPNRFPIVCNALRSTKFLRENHLKLQKVEGPPSGRSSTVTFVYKLEPVPRGSQAPKQANANECFLSLRGILKSTYQKLGGAETFHRRQSESWDE